MPTIADVRQKLPQYSHLDDGQLVELVQRVYYPQVPRDALAQRLGVQQQAPAGAAPQESGFLRSAADTGLAAVGGVVKGVKMLSDAAGADSAVSQTLGEARDYLGSLESPARQQQRAERAAKIKAAEASGSKIQEIGAYLGSIADAPLDTIVEAAGTMVPTIGAALIPGVGPAAAAARVGAGLGLGAAQGAGAVKGTIYEDTRRALLDAGYPEDVAAQRASIAQGYAGPNSGQIALGAGLGAVAGRTGLEGAAERLARGVPGTVRGTAARVAGGAVAEGIPEALQGGQEKYASNAALRNEGFDVDPMTGVYGSGALEGVTGGALGGVMGVPKPAQRQPAPGRTQRESLPDPHEQAIDGFRSLASKYGLSGDALKAVEKAARSKPADEAGAYMRRVAEAYQRKGLFGKPLDPADLDALFGQNSVPAQAPGASNTPAQAGSAQPTPAPAVPPGVDPETGEVLQQPTGPLGQFASEDDALNYLSQQRRAPRSMPMPEAAPYQHDDGSWSLAVAGTPEFGLAQQQRVQRQQAGTAPAQDQAGGFGSAGIVPDAPFEQRLAGLREQFADETNRQRIRERWGSEGLNEALYRLNIAARADTPARTRENELGVAERLLFDAQTRLEPKTQPLGSQPFEAPAQLGAAPTALALPYDDSPTGRMRAGADGVAMPETRADAINTAQAQRERRQAEVDALVERASLGQQGRRASAVYGEGMDPPPRRAAPPVNMPERRRTEGVVLDPVQAYVNERRRANTPADHFFVREFDAGRITPDEVAEIMGRRPQSDDEAAQERLQGAAAQARSEPTADERLAAAAAQARQADGLLGPDGLPLQMRAQGEARGSLAEAAERQEASEQPAAAPAPAAELLGTPLDQAAHAAATSPTNDRREPTAAEQQAGNYAKGHVRVAGLDIAIENPQGSVRRGVSSDGKAWQTPMRSHYGYVKGTKAIDGDAVDVFIKPGTPEDYAGPAFVVDQVDPKTGRFDEHKAVLGAASLDEARELYLQNYEPGWRGVGSITQVPMAAFKSWVKDGKKRQPLGDLGEAQPLDDAAPAAEDTTARLLTKYGARAAAAQAGDAAPIDAAELLGTPLGQPAAAPAQVAATAAPAAQGLALANLFKKGDAFDLDGRPVHVVDVRAKALIVAGKSGRRRTLGNGSVPLRNLVEQALQRAAQAQQQSTTATDLAALPLTDVFAVGDTFKLGGKPMRVSEVKLSVVQLTGEGGKVRSVSRSGASFKQLLEQVAQQRAQAAPTGASAARAGVAVPGAQHIEGGSAPAVEQASSGEEGGVLRPSEGNAARKQAAPDAPLDTPALSRRKVRAAPRATASEDAGVAHTSETLSPQPESSVAPAQDDGGEAALRRGSFGRPGVPAGELRAAVERITSEWASQPNGPRVQVVTTVDDLPEDARDRLERLGALEEVRGFYMPDGRVFLIANRLKSLAEGQQTLFHEVYGHFGMRTLLGRDGYMREMMLLRQANPALRREADAWFAAYSEGEIEARVSMGLSRDEATRWVRALSTEEALADRAGQDTPPNGWKGLMARLQKALRRAGLDAVADWLEGKTEAETWALLRDARKLAREGRQQPAAASARPAPAREAAASRSEPALSRTAANDAQPLDLPALSRVGDLLGSADGARAVRDAAGDLFKNPGVFNAWHKSVGTQYEKARKSPIFRRVYEAAQDFLHDTSFFANTAADQAPDLLPRMESLKDVAKRLTLSKVDSEAVAKAAFTGTLENRRFDADQLRERFDFTDQQVELYRQFRAAVDTSLEQLANAEVSRLMGDDAPGGARALLQGGDYGAHRASVEAHIADQAVAARKELQDTRDRHARELEALRAAGKEPDAELQDQHAKDLRPLEAAVKKWQSLDEQVGEKFERLDTLKAQGYAPLMRFGRYSVHVTDDAGETLYFGLYESRLEANRAQRALQEEFRDVSGATATTGVMSLEAYKLMQGVSPETLAVFGDASGLSKDEVFQQYLKMATANHSALRRLIHRKGIAGFNQNPTRVLAAFVTSNARRASSLLHNGDMDKAVRAAQESKQGDVADEAFKLRDYVQNPQEEAAGLRNLLFVNYIGGSVASALVNLTQPLTMTLPYLSQFGGSAKAGARLLAATKDALGAISDERLKEALKRAEAEGIVAPQEMHELQAEAQRRLSNHELARKGLFLWGSLFSLAEQMNRRVTFIAAWRTATAEGKGDPFAFAIKAVDETQGIYNKGNKPNWARGAVGGTAMVYKQFAISYLEWFGRLPAREKALAMAVLILASGLQGLPFADDLDDVLDTIGQRLDYNTNSKLWKQRVLTEALGKPVADLLLRGVTGLPGSPIDVAGRMSLGNLLPATGLLRKDREDRGADIAEVAGAVGGLKRQFEAAADGDWIGALPIGLQNIAKGMDMAATGAYRDTRGRKVMETDAVDAVMKGIGFQPGAVAQEQRRAGAIQQTINMAKAVREEVSARWAEGLFEGDQDKVQSAREQLRAWNEKNPESRINLPVTSIMKRVKAMRSSREDRLEKAAPKSMRPAVRDALAA